jgi:S1 RNA binding domain protein
MVEAKTTDLTGQEMSEGEITECTVEQIMPYGVFVRITKNGKKGMIHISELSYGFVKNIGDIVKISDKIQAKIIRIDERGRIDLSLKQTQEPPQVQSRPMKRESRPERPEAPRRPDRPDRPERSSRPPREFREARDYHEIRASMKIPPVGSNESFEQKMSAFLKTSEAKITDLNSRNSSRVSSRRSSKGRRDGRGY